MNTNPYEIQLSLQFGVNFKFGVNFIYCHITCNLESLTGRPLINATEARQCKRKRHFDVMYPLGMSIHYIFTTSLKDLPNHILKRFKGSIAQLAEIFHRFTFPTLVFSSYMTVIKQLQTNK